MTDFLPIQSIDYVEFYVGNAKQAMHYFVKGFGFKTIAYCGMETGVRDRVSYVLEQNKMRFVLSGTFQQDHPIAEFTKLHGDGVKDIALQVDDVEFTYKEAVSRGAIPIMEPTVYSDENGEFKKATIGTYGDTVHTFIERTNYKGVFAPGFVAYNSPITAPETGIAVIDHIVGNVELNKMEDWVKYYETVLGFTELNQFTDEDINTEYSALMSKVMQNGTGRIKFPINEPAEGKRKSQIQEYLDFYNSPGVQHIALATDDIITTVTKLKENGIEFLSVPSSYYEMLEDRIGPIEEDWNKIRELQILVDQDEEGYLLQLFTKPIVDRPTLFIEIIERKGSRGFGAGNFKALFEAIEREQALRGNL